MAAAHVAQKEDTKIKTDTGTLLAHFVHQGSTREPVKRIAIHVDLDNIRHRNRPVVQFAPLVNTIT